MALTIDIDLQQVVEDTLASTIQGMIDKDSNERGGAAAVIQVGTGEVLAMASYPTYDLETFNQDYDELVKDERLPMFNRATQGVYAPGSTFKLCTSVAALEEGSRPSACLSCGKCVRACPQGIDVPAHLATFARGLEALPRWAKLCRKG